MRYWAGLEVVIGVAIEFQYNTILCDEMGFVGRECRLRIHATFIHRLLAINQEEIYPVECLGPYSGTSPPRTLLK